MWGKRRESIGKEKIPEEKRREFSVRWNIKGEDVDKFAALEEFYGLLPGKSEVAILNRAINILKWVTGLRQKGNELYTKNDEGDFVPVDFDKFDMGA